MDPEPAMGVHPSPADLARHNAWADRNHQPRMAGQGAAAVPPPPVAPRRRGWQRGRPRGVPPPVPHGALGEAEQHPDDKWIRGTHLEGNRKTVAYMVSGRKFVVAWRNSVTEQMRVTPKGEDYYRHTRQEFIFKIPVIAYRNDNGRTIKCWSGYIPITEEYLIF